MDIHSVWTSAVYLPMISTPGPRARDKVRVKYGATLIDIFLMRGLLSLLFFNKGWFR